MNKPLVFNYRDYTDLKEKCEQLEKENEKLKHDNRNLLIRCRIAETNVNEMDKVILEEVTKLREEIQKESSKEIKSADTVSRKDTVTLNSPISIQADMVSVVRCKDCRFYWGNLSEDDTDEMYGECRWDSDEMPNADDFCSYGERREERAEPTEYKLPFEDDIMERLDKLTLRGDDE